MTLEGMSVYGDQIQAIKHTILQSDFGEGRGTTERVDLLGRYVTDEQADDSVLRQTGTHTQ